MIHNPYTVSLFSANTGVLSARLDHENGTFLHLHSLVDPESEADYFSDIRLWGDRIVLAGCGLGYHLKRCCVSIRPDAKILLLEYHDELAVYSKKLISDIVANELIAVTGTNDDVGALLKEFLAGGRYVQIIRHPPSFHAHATFYRSILAAIHHVPQRKKNNSLMLMQGDFFAEQELFAAANANGTTCTAFRYKENNYGALYEAHIQEVIQTAMPEAILSINMLGIDSDGILVDYAQRHGIPMLHWFVDDPRPIMVNRKKLITRNMIAFTWERAYLPFLKECGFSKVNYLPLAADPDQFRATSREKPAVDFGFIGSSMGKAFLDGIAAKFIWKPFYEKIAAAVSRTMFEGFCGDIDVLINDELKKNNAAGTTTDEHTLTWLRSYCIHSASMMKRQRFISALQPVGIEVFGDPEGWKQLCGPSLVTHPDLDYRTAIAGQYRAIRININITSCQMPTAVNQRVFDVPLCDSFVLNDYQSDLEELFSADEYEIFHSPEELLDKAVFFRRHDTIRAAITLRACKRILHEHTYGHRLRKIMEMI